MLVTSKLNSNNDNSSSSSSSSSSTNNNNNNNNNNSNANKNNDNNIITYPRPENTGFMSNGEKSHLMGRGILFSLGWQSV